MKFFLLIFSFTLGFGLSYLQHSQNLAIKILEKTISQCSENAGFRDEMCARKKIKSAIIFFNPLTIINSLEKAKSDCHELGHVVGELVSQKGQFSQLIVSCQNICDYGCTHGVMMGEIKRSPEKINDLTSLCQPLSFDFKSGQGYTACKHGLGHALVELNSYDLNSSLDICDNFLSQIDKDECASGVFMEIIDSDNGLSLSCASLPANFISFCERNLAGWHYRLTKDLQTAINTCESEGKRNQLSCWETLGSEIYFTVGGEIGKVTSECLRLGGERTELCLKGALFSSFVADRDGEIAKQMCATIQDNYWRQNCLSLSATLKP